VIRDAELARRLWSRLEPIHAVTYFSPEARAALSGAGYKGFWMGYFAGRAAPMGPVGPEVVFATFYNFSIAHVSRAIPDAWTFAPPSAALEERERGSAAALRRAFARRDLAEAVEMAAVLARAAADQRQWKAAPCSPPTGHCRGRRNRLPPCGRPAHCCASTEATGMSQLWPPPE
jgi:hypothetical protein